MIFNALLKREILLGLRQRIDIGYLIIFAIISTMLFPLAIGPDITVLRKIAVGLIWVVLVFTTQLSVSTVWGQDIEDGTLEQIYLAGIPLELLVIVKALSIWIIYLGCLGALLPVLAYGLYLQLDEILTLLLCFTIASLPISLLTVTGGTLTLGSSKGSFLSAILLLPFYVPILIFSCSASESAQGISLYLYMLGGFCLILTPLLIYVNTFLISHNME